MARIATVLETAVGCAALVLASVPAGAQEPTSVWDGVYTVEQAERGARAYEQGCAECHGAALGGDDMSPPLIGSDFLWDWNGLSLGDLLERVKISMPDGKPKSMSTQEKADALAFILSQNEFPSGNEEIGTRTDDLRGISIDAAKPQG